jgi:hypothetical protein
LLFAKRGSAPAPRPAGEPRRTARVSGIRWGVPALGGIVDSTLQPPAARSGSATCGFSPSLPKMVAKRVAKVWTSPGQRAET